MATTTPLTDAINALTTYANSVTGGSDTDLSSAVATLASGYGGGGEDNLGKLISDTLTSYSSDVAGTGKAYTFKNAHALTSVELPNLTTLSTEFFYDCRNLTSVKLSSVATLDGANHFRQCYALTTIALPSLTKIAPASAASFFNATALTTADMGQLNVNGLGSNFFLNAPLTTLILRYNGVCPLNNVSAFNGTPFASGGTGGTIYVPSALISSYKSATNWSTLNGYGTVTWTAIEGSQYENYYADGTAI